MATDKDVVKALRGYERVAWNYDGLNGKIIRWTKEHGGTSDDPSCQAFVLCADGTVLARASDQGLYRAGSFSKWLVEQAGAYEKLHPRTRMPFVRGALVTAREEGQPPVCRAARKALGDGRPVLLYFGRGALEDPTRAQKKEIKASLKFEKGTLDSKKAAEVAGGVTLLRFDLGDERSAAYAASFGVKAAPALVLMHGGADGPEVLKRGISGAGLAYQLKRVTEGD